jgi:hypothetical protein
MTASPNSYTLADLALNSNDPLVQKITYSLIMAGMVLQDLPLVDYKSMKANGVRFQGNNLPQPAWRNLNEDPTTVKGTPTPFQEQAYTLSNTIDVDKKLSADINSIQDPFSLELNAYLTATKYEINTKFILNDHLTGDPKAPIGLRARLDQYALFGNEAEMKIDCGTLNLSQAGITAAIANKFLEFLDQTLSYMGADDGMGVVFYVNDLMLRRIPFLIRLLGAGAGFEMTSDAFDRRVLNYRNAKIMDIGRKQDQASRIISNTENADGTDTGAGTNTSIYAVKYGLENAFRGWQFDALEDSIVGPFLLPGGVQQRLVIDWTVGYFQEHTRSVARLFDIKVA